MVCREQELECNVMGGQEGEIECNGMGGQEVKLSRNYEGEGVKRG